MEIKQFVWDVVDANSWLMTEDNHGLLIDAVDNPKLYEALQPLESLTIILTHCHFDHIIGLNRIREIKPDCTVISTRLCSEHIGNKYRNMSASADAFLSFYQQGKNREIHIEPVLCLPADQTVEDSSEMTWNGHQIRLRPLHGHSADSLVITMDNQLFFSGDSLMHTPVVTRLPGGSTARFKNEDLPFLKSLDTEKVYPGHGSAGDRTQMIAINE